MRKITNQSNVKDIIRNGIDEKIDFNELRSRLPEMKKRPIVSLVFDVMEETGIKQIPFPGMVVRPRLTRKAIPVDKDGTLNIIHILEEKGFDTMECEARCHVGKNKITLTIKPIQDAKQDEKSSNSSEEIKTNCNDVFERMDFSSY